MQESETLIMVKTADLSTVSVLLSLYVACDSTDQTTYAFPNLCGCNNPQIVAITSPEALPNGKSAYQPVRGSGPSVELHFEPMASKFACAALLFLALLHPCAGYTGRLFGNVRGQRSSLRHNLHLAPFALVEQSSAWQGDIAGIVGGSFGVIGTLVFYEKRRFKMYERVLCPYCKGTGFLTCAVCHGAESLQIPAGAEDHVPPSSLTADGEFLCPNCEGAGAVVCPNCKGEGLSMPGQLIRQTLDIEVDDLEEIMSQASVAAMQADHEMALAKKKKRMMLERKARAKVRSTGEGRRAEE